MPNPYHFSTEVFCITFFSNSVYILKLVVNHNSVLHLYISFTLFKLFIKIFYTFKIYVLNVCVVSVKLNICPLSKAGRLLLDPQSMCEKYKGVLPLPLPPVPTFPDLVPYFFTKHFKSHALLTALARHSYQDILD